MASADTTITTTCCDNNNNNGEAIAKAVKLRALHAALLQNSSPSSAFGASPSSRPLPNLSAQDYPVFTPSYDDEPLPAFHQKNPKLSESWDECAGCLEEEEDREQEEFRNNFLSDSYKASASRKIRDLQSHVCPMTDDLRSPQAYSYTSGRRNCSSGDFRSVSSCNRCKPAAVGGGFDTKSMKNSNIVVPLTDTHSSVVSSQPRNKGGVISWLFPKFRKRQKNNGSVIFNSPNRTDKSEEVSQVLKDSSGVMSIEKLKRELMEANKSRDAALTEVSEMKSSLGELSQKLEYLETYCESLKKALRQATTSRENIRPERFWNVPRKGVKKSMDGTSENSGMPVSEDVMVEGFLQIVSEARLSVKQFLQTLISQIEEDDATLFGNIDSLLQSYNLSFNSKYSKTIQYHLEAIINQSIYQDFENSVFQKNGTPKFLDPEQDRQSQFSSFVSLRNLSWNEVLKKGTKYYSEEFSRFCDNKMNLIITTLNWNRPWSEQLLQAFFVAAKCIWLLHLLAFSFNPPLGVLRVEENRVFESNYMEDMAGDRQRSSSSRGPARVKVMVMPGFYVQDRVLRCKVLCRYKS
ncbi:PREDICTED: IRK-interacting protein [Tarenaya hassleriana]|uniref:IRK-interacting protein n=1 Tax=Tarenaya hassleriana TaxID=28532 RepID=UPI00053C3118|nr:PREDICTED: IRK-interacting protein [Tarenaya hassleriana]